VNNRWHELKNNSEKYPEIISQKHLYIIFINRSILIFC